MRFELLNFRSLYDFLEIFEAFLSFKVAIKKIV